MTYREKSIELYNELVNTFNEYKATKRLDERKAEMKKCCWENLHKIYVDFNNRMKQNGLDYKEYELD